jgi:hypothetical protein
MWKHRYRSTAGKQIGPFRVGAVNRGTIRLRALIISNGGNHIITSNGNRITTNGI